MKILKFGGKSLANGTGINKVIEIIEDKVNNGEQITVVLSARGTSTDELESILEKAVKNESYQEQLKVFKKYQVAEYDGFNVDSEFEILDKLFEGVSLLGDYSKRIKDQVLSQGEVISAKLVTYLLKGKGLNAKFADSRNLIKTDNAFGEAQPLDKLSKENIISHFKKHNGTTINVAGKLSGCRGITKFHSCKWHIYSKS